VVGYDMPSHVKACCSVSKRVPSTGARRGLGAMCLISQGSPAADPQTCFPASSTTDIAKTPPPSHPFLCLYTPFSLFSSLLFLQFTKNSATMASVSSLDKDLSRLRSAKYSAKDSDEIKQWFSEVLQAPLPDGKDLMDCLKDGVLLCR